MYVARILYPIKVLGPGLRVGIWFAGCKHQCNGCSNPELWDFDEKYSTSVNDVMDLVFHIAQYKQVDGFTITGGDPVEQSSDLLELIERLKEISEDILVYTGYTLEEVQNKCPKLLDKISVLVDGKYIEEENHGDILKGSSNQKIIILDKTKEEIYKAYISQTENLVQNFFIDNSTISVGIHKPGYEGDLDKALEKKGLRHG